MRYEADVGVLCTCGCSTNLPDGIKVSSFSDETYPQHTYEVQKAGDGGIDMPLATGLADALGQIIAKVMEDHLPPLYGVDPSELSYIAAQIQGHVPGSASDGHWLKGKSPCTK